MPRVSSTVTVPLDPARAFALSQTYGELRYRWDPFVREQRLLDGATAAAKGVRTWTRSRHRLTMVSEYVTFRPPGHVGMKMVRGPVVLPDVLGRVELHAGRARPERGARTEATWRYNFTIRPGLAGAGRRPHRRVAAGP